MVTLRRAALWLLILLLITFSILRNEFQIGNLFRNEFEIGGNNLLQHENNETKDYLPVKMIPRRKIIFLHVGKAGGSTLKETLKIHCSANHWLPPKTKKVCEKNETNLFCNGGGRQVHFPST